VKSNLSKFGRKDISNFDCDSEPPDVSESSDFKSYMKCDIDNN